MIITAKNKVKKEEFWTEKFGISIYIYGNKPFRFKEIHVESDISQLDEKPWILSYPRNGKHQYILPNIRLLVYIYDYYDIAGRKLLEIIKL